MKHVGAVLFSAIYMYYLGESNVFENFTDKNDCFNRILIWSQIMHTYIRPVTLMQLRTTFHEFYSFGNYLGQRGCIGKEISYAIHFVAAMIATNTKNLSKCRDCLMSNKWKCQIWPDHALTSTYVNCLTLFKSDWNASRRTHNGHAFEYLRTWINGYVGCVALLLWIFCKQCIHTQTKPQMIYCRNHMHIRTSHIDACFA